MIGRRDLLLASLGLVAARSPGAEPADQTIQRLLEQAVGAGGQLAGIIAVVADKRGTRTFTYGSSGVPGVALDAETTFEIGSLTKVLTALILADMVTRGEVAFDDPVAKYLPPSVTLRVRGRPITLLDLATYTSGLPNIPGNFRPPLAGYTIDKLYEFLSTYLPDYEPGTHYEYANVSFGLLGIALALRAGKSYEALLKERVCDPLRLDDTRIALTGHMRRHLAQGHGLDLRPTPLLDLPPAMQGAGAVRSSARDVALFLKAVMELVRTPLDASLTKLLATRRRTTLAGTEAALGWFVSSDGNDEIVWKSGLTDGFSAFVGFSKRTQRGALVLSNFVGASRDVGTIELGMNVINVGFHPGDLRLLYAGMR